MAGELALVLTRHQQLIRTNYPKVSTFLSQYFGDSDVATIATAAADKLGLTLADGEQHSVVLEREEVVDHITTLPVDMPQAMEWFGRTAGGYTKFLGDVWDSALPKTTTSVWCHVIYGPHAGGAWVHMAVCAVRTPAPIGITVMPIEFLTPEERKAIGVARPKRSGYLTRLSRCETPADSHALSRRPTTSSPCPRTAGCPPR